MQTESTRITSLVKTVKQLYHPKSAKQPRSVEVLIGCRLKAAVIFFCCCLQQHFQAQQAAVVRNKANRLGEQLLVKKSGTFSNR